MAAPADALGDTAAPTNEVDALGATLASHVPKGNSPPRIARGTSAPQGRRYVIQRELARGGMGRISIAHDTLLDRTVALKELLVQGGELAGRFNRELALTSRLQHPSIVAIHDGGVWPGGEPYYVMKLVTGEPFDRVITKHATAAERMALLPHAIAVADALAYAHDQAIIHRDLKPANVLIGEFGETVVIDWGLAKDMRHDEETMPALRSSSSLETIDGAVMGTPSYMPPEQAHGDVVDERADVYAIGALLYHVLAGAPPYQGKTVDEILLAVTDGPPRPLAERAPETPPALITIVDKAMARDPVNRYPTAAALSADLKRFQRGQLVASHQYTARELLGRWLRKHRTAVVVGAVAAAALVVVGVVSFRRVVQEERVAIAERAEAIASRDDAERMLDLMLGSVREALEPIGKLDLLDKVAREAQRYYEHRPTATTPDDQTRQAVAWETLGHVVRGQGHLPEAMDAYQRVLTLRQRLVASTPADMDRYVGLASAYRSLADVLADQGKVALAIDELRREQSVIALAVAATPGDLVLARNATVGRLRIGEMLMQQGNAKGALVEYRAVLASREKIAAAKPEVLLWQADVAATRERIGDTLRVSGDPTGALVELRAALATMVALTQREPTNTDFKFHRMMDHDRVGNAYRDMGKVSEGVAAFRECLALGAELGAIDPTNTTWLSERADCHYSLGVALFETGDAEGSLRDLRAAIDIRDRLVAADRTNAVWLGGLAAGRLLLGQRLLGSDPATAVAELRKGRDLSQQVLALDASNKESQAHVAIHLYALGNALVATGDVKGALVELRASVAMREQLLASDPARVSWQGGVSDSRASLGMALLDAGDLVHAEYELVTAVDLSAKIVASAPANIGAVYDLANRRLQLAMVLIARRMYAEAAVQFDEGCKLGAQVVAADPTNPGFKQDLVQAHLIAAEELGNHVPDATRRHRAAAKLLGTAVPR